MPGSGTAVLDSVSVSYAPGTFTSPGFRLSAYKTDRILLTHVTGLLGATDQDNTGKIYCPLFASVRSGHDVIHCRAAVESMGPGARPLGFKSWLCPL